MERGRDGPPGLPMGRHRVSGTVKAASRSDNRQRFARAGRTGDLLRARTPESAGVAWWGPNGGYGLSIAAPGRPSASSAELALEHVEREVEHRWPSVRTGAGLGARFELAQQFSLLGER